MRKRGSAKGMEIVVVIAGRCLNPESVDLDLDKAPAYPLRNSLQVYKLQVSERA